jgi:hypothetical protein
MLTAREAKTGPGAFVLDRRQRRCSNEGTATVGRNRTLLIAVALAYGVWLAHRPSE